MDEVLVLGGGYTGVATAVGLARRTRRLDVRITLVNPTDRFTERLRLHQVATGQRLAELRISELLNGTGVRFVPGWVTAIEPGGRMVRIDDERTLRYDTLVYALGSVADSLEVPGVEEHAYTLESAQHAQALALRLRALGDDATVVVCGAGLTGVETAAEIAENYPRVRVRLLSAGEPGAVMGPKARAYLRAGLDRLGVTVRTGVRVDKVLPTSVRLAGGELLGADAVVWTAGVRASALAGKSGIPVDERGRVVVDATLRSVSHPEIYAVGDAAAVSQNYGVIHGTCQSGIPTAAHAAATIARRMRGKPASGFRFGYLHQPVSLGRRDAVIQFTRPDDTPGRFALTGRWASAYKETVSSSPWPAYRLMKWWAGALRWRRGGQATRTAS